ncbi:MAG: hypothetical protein IJX39_05380 [Clostridia bacterium]|nr:hypothetical protein [Clostridia bacterium]
MSERYNAAEIGRMSQMILKTADDMERDLEEIIKNLNIYKGCLKDAISADAELLVTRIRDRIDAVRIEFGERGENAKSAAIDIDHLENTGLEGQ